MRGYNLSAEKKGREHSEPRRLKLLHELVDSIAWCSRGEEFLHRHLQNFSEVKQRLVVDVGEPRFDLRDAAAEVRCDREWTSQLDRPRSHDLIMRAGPSVKGHFDFVASRFVDLLFDFPRNLRVRDEWILANPSGTRDGEIRFADMDHVSFARIRQPARRRSEARCRTRPTSQSERKRW